MGAKEKLVLTAVVVGFLLLFMRAAAAMRDMRRRVDELSESAADNVSAEDVQHLVRVSMVKAKQERGEKLRIRKTKERDAYIEALREQNRKWQRAAEAATGAA